MKELSGHNPEKKSTSTEISGLSDPGQVIRRKVETFTAIGTGEIQPAKPWKKGERGGDSLDATLKVIRTKEAVEGSLRKSAEEAPDIYQAEVNRLREGLQEIREGVNKGYISPDVVARHEQDLTILRSFAQDKTIDLPREKPKIKPESIGKGREIEGGGYEFTFSTGKTFYGDQARVVELLVTSPTEYLLTDKIGIGLWGEQEYQKNKPKLYGQIKRLIPQIKVELTDTDCEMLSRNGVLGGFKIVKKEEEK